MKRCFLIILLFAFAGPWQLHAQETTLRERLKERLMERKQETAAGPEVITQPGDYSYTLHQGDLKRAYLVHVPPVYDPASAMPVVFAFHGGGGDMHLQANTNYNLVGKADSAGFIAVFPNGFSRLPSGKLATWNTGNCCAQARDRNIDDVGFVRSLVAQVQKQLNVDRLRIFATGMSNGGMMSHRLACEMADTFAAIAPVAGTDGTLECTPARPISVLQIHAKNDTHVLFEGGAGKDAFKDQSMVANFVSVPETMARWTQRNRCTGATKRVLGVPGAYCEAQLQCADGARVQWCVTEKGGHSWPGVKDVRAGKEPASQAINANDVMWDFFQSVTQR
jgi:polyhydroxybutyrate depolymerase